MHYTLADGLRSVTARPEGRDRFPWAVRQVSARPWPRRAPEPSRPVPAPRRHTSFRGPATTGFPVCIRRSEEHTSELQSLMRISYAVFCLKKKSNTYLPMIHHLTHTINITICHGVTQMSFITDQAHISRTTQ